MIYFTEEKLLQHNVSSISPLEIIYINKIICRWVYIYIYIYTHTYIYMNKEKGVGIKSVYAI